MSGPKFTDVFVVEIRPALTIESQPFLARNTYGLAYSPDLGATIITKTVPSEATTVAGVVGVTVYG
jgi:hypothetical protein